MSLAELIAEFENRDRNPSWDRANWEKEVIALLRQGAKAKETVKGFTRSLREHQIGLNFEDPRAAEWLSESSDREVLAFLKSLIR